MGNFVKTYSSFTHGEISPEFFNHDNVFGLSRLENMDVLAGGGLNRRKGLKHITDLYNNARLLSFCVSEDKNYILALVPGHIVIYDTYGQLIRDMLSPWNSVDIKRVQYAQRFNSIIFVHPNYRPYILQSDENGFSLNIFEFARDDASMNTLMPFVRFPDTDDISITITANGNGNNFATFTASRACWTSDVVGNIFAVIGRQWIVRDFINASQLVVYTNGTYSLPSGPILDWRECAFSNTRGWPCSITFHQDRLVFGGSRDFPSGVWLSQVGKHTNFDVGTGLDDQAIFITLLSKTRQQISTVVSSDNLQILTADGEWAISNKPLTPSSVDIKQHASVGSITDCYLAPQYIDGVTVFVSRSGHDIRELVLDELGESYNANDLCLMSKHLMNTPIDIAYNGTEHRLYIVMQDGKMAVLNKYTASGVSAWARYSTNGIFKSVCVINDETFVCVQREGKFALEKFTDTELLDSSVYNFSSCASSVPLRASGHNARLLRVRRATVRLINTKSVFINGVRANLPDDIYRDTAKGFSGDVSVDFLGTNLDAFTPVWTVNTDDAMPMTVLSVTIYGRYSI